MTTSTTLIGDRRRQALERSAAIRRHPARRPGARSATPPPVEFYLIAVVIAVFVMLGLVMVLSASSISQLHRGNSPWRLFNKQLLWAVLGVAGLWTAMRVPLHFWRRLVTPMLGVAMAMMVLPFVGGFGQQVNGATAWVSIGPFTIQPSEFLKLAILLFCANLLTKRQLEMNNPRRTLVPALVVAGIGAGLCLAQSDLGSAIVIGCIVFVMAFIAGAPFIPMAAAGVRRSRVRGRLRDVQPASRRPVHRVHGRRSGTRTTSAIRRIRRGSASPPAGSPGRDRRAVRRRWADSCPWRTATSSSP